MWCSEIVCGNLKHLQRLNRFRILHLITTKEILINVYNIIIWIK